MLVKYFDTVSQNDQSSFSRGLDWLARNCFIHIAHSVRDSCLEKCAQNVSTQIERARNMQTSTSCLLFIIQLSIGKTLPRFTCLLLYFLLESLFISNTSRWRFDMVHGWSSSTDAELPHSFRIVILKCCNFGTRALCLIGSEFPGW